MAAKGTKNVWAGLLVLALLGPVAAAEECVLKLPYSDWALNATGPAFEIGNEYLPWIYTPPVLDGSPWLSPERYGIRGWYEYTFFALAKDPNIVVTPPSGTVVVDPNGTVRIPGHLLTRSYKNVGILGGDDFGVSAVAENGDGLYAKGSSGHYAAKLDGKTLVKGDLHVEGVITTGGLDYAEGFDVSGDGRVGPGAVLVIDPLAPGKLTVSRTAYDTKVAGIVAGAKGLGSGVRLGVGQFDRDVALAGRVYCNVDATRVAVRPGDLLTTATEPGYAMKVTNPTRAQGAILGKAMEGLDKGKKGQILVLVTLQ
jgi:hypothetical protein